MYHTLGFSSLLSLHIWSRLCIHTGGSIVPVTSSFQFLKTFKSGHFWLQFSFKDLFGLKELSGCLHGACCLSNGRSVDLMGENVNMMVKDHCGFVLRYFCSATQGQKLPCVTEAGRMWRGSSLQLSGIQSLRTFSSL